MSLKMVPLELAETINVLLLVEMLKKRRKPTLNATFA